MRFKIVSILLIFLFPIFADGDYKKKVDSLIEASSKKHSQVEFIESLKIAEKALILSKEIKYAEGEILSYLLIASVLQEVGLKKEALLYLEKVEHDKHSKKNAYIQSEIFRLKGRIASSEHLYSLEKQHYLKQLEFSKDIKDPLKKESTISWAYFFIQHLYVKQNNLDSAKVYQNLLEDHLVNAVAPNSSYHRSSLYADKGLLFINRGKYDEAVRELDKSLEVIEKSNIPFFLYTLQIYGDLEIARGDTIKAITYYKKALENSIQLSITHKTRDLHKKLSNHLMHNDLTVDEGKIHLKEYITISDSLERHNTMLADLIMSALIKEKEKSSAKKSRNSFYFIIGLIAVTIITGRILIARNRRSEKSITKKNKQLQAKTEQIGQLEDELESNIFKDIIELAKSNSPEFLPLFTQSYPEFVESVKQLDPNIRSSELYFCALAYLNFSTKDIADFTFVTIRAVQIRRNRMRKKYDIPSEIDFNEWFRDLVGQGVYV